MSDWTRFDWDGYKARERAYLEEYFRRRDRLRERDRAARIKKVRIMNAAGLACSENDPDYFMFHNPFVGRWVGIDFGIAEGVLDIEARVRADWDEFWRWSRENDPWPPSGEPAPGGGLGGFRENRA